MQKSASILLERDLVRHWSEDNGREPRQNLAAVLIHDCNLAQALSGLHLQCHFSHELVGREITQR